MARGKPRTSPGRGKKVDTLFYDVDSTAAQNDGSGAARHTQKIAIDIYLEKILDTKDAPPPAQTLGIGLTAVCEATGEEVFGTDLNAILCAMRSKLDRRYAIKWDRWLLVKIDPVRTIEQSGAGLQLTWREVERGEAADGSVMMRSFNVHSDWRNRWIIEPWPDIVKEKGQIVATIPATDENELALRTFSEKIVALREALATLVSPDEIQKTLSRIMTAPLASLAHDTPE